MIPERVSNWLQEQGFGAVVRQQAASGGCINNGFSLHTSSGDNFFLKTNSHAPEDLFAREAEGLKELASGPGPRVPQTYLVGADFLLLEDLQPSPRNAEYWPALGRQLAALHERTQAQFGFAHDNYIGSTLQPNPMMDDGHAFFAEKRLLFQAHLAQDKGLLNSGEVSQVEALAARLPDLVPAQDASLLHGDLWGGNAISDAQGAPALIDPAVHYGWAEAELGMTRLFGGFDPSFFHAYVEARPLEPGWEGRLPIYNLYHLLNHLNLFGRGYYSQVTGILQAFA